MTVDLSKVRRIGAAPKSAPQASSTLPDFAPRIIVDFPFLSDATVEQLRPGLWDNIKRLAGLSPNYTITFRRVHSNSEPVTFIHCIDEDGNTGSASINDEEWRSARGAQNGLLLDAMEVAAFLLINPTEDSQEED